MGDQFVVSGNRFDGPAVFGSNNRVVDNRDGLAAETDLRTLLQALEAVRQYLDGQPRDVPDPQRARAELAVIERAATVPGGPEQGGRLRLALQTLREQTVAVAGLTEALARIGEVVTRHWHLG